MSTEKYVTYKEMTESQQIIKKDIMERIERGDTQIEKLDTKVNNIDDKVDGLNDLVLPLTVAMNQTAENTKEISQSLKEFTKSQSETNGIFYDRIGQQAVALEGMRSITNGITDKKKYNATIIVAIISLIGVFITGLFTLAPIIFNG